MPMPPFISVVMPVKNGRDVLPRSLAALRRSDLPRECWELIVVDDVSTDDSAVIASGDADLVIRLVGVSRGPAYARNRGVERARGECVVFLDADVEVHADTLRRFGEVFVTQPDVAAVFGAYDDRPAAPGLVSQYRNLLHHYVHLRSAGDAETFWAGCGAVRRAEFVAAGMYDEWRFSRPQIEDVELGYRMRARGRRILLRPDIECTHLKRWTLRTTIVADLTDRGVPWARLLLEEGVRRSFRSESAKALNLAVRERYNTIGVWAAGSSATIAIVTGRPGWAVAAATWIWLVLWSNRRLYAFFERKRGFWFALAVIPLHLMCYLINGLSVLSAYGLTALLGAPRPAPIVEALSEVGVETWPPVPLNPSRPSRPVTVPLARG